MKTAVLGTGMAAPDPVLASSTLESRLGVPAGWIESRTGVAERRVAAPGQATSDLAAAAAAQALRRSGVAGQDVDLLILATSTPDHPLPPSAPVVAHRLGLRCGAFDLAAACSGFLYGLAAADRWVRCGGGPVLLVAANVLTRRLDWSDRATAPLFGDGAGAVVLGPSKGGSGVLATHLAADGSRWQQVHVPAGGTRQPLTPEAVAQGLHTMRMLRGPELFRAAVAQMAEAAEAALAAAEVRAAEVDWFVPHQANGRMIDGVARRLGMAEERVIRNLSRYGNTSAATIPMALHEASADGRLRRGETVLLCAVGAGLVSAGAVVRW